MIDELLKHYSDATMTRARTAVNRDDVLLDERGQDIFWVLSSDKSKRYRVQLWPEDVITCTCTNGKHLFDQPRCFHTAAVLLKLKDIQLAQRVREVYGDQFGDDDGSTPSNS